MINKIKKNWLPIGVILLFGVWLHITMKQDEAHLCSNEATAFAECSK